jgi:hypothetical protein
MYLGWGVQVLGLGGAHRRQSRVRVWGGGPVNSSELERTEGLEGGRGRWRTGGGSGWRAGRRGGAWRRRSRVAAAVGGCAGEKEERAKGDGGRV